MKVSYTREQRLLAVKTYKKLRNYSATIRVLGYPSLHVLHDWVRDGVDGKGAPRRPGTLKHYPWTLKREAVDLVLSGEDIRDVADRLSVTTHAIIYNWIRKWRLEGDEGLMSKKERIDVGVYKTRVQLEKSLPDDIGELKKIASRLMAEKAILEQELELVKKDEGVIPGKLSTKSKAEIVSKLRGLLPLSLLLEAASLKASSYYYSLAAMAKPDKYADVRGEIHEISKLSANTYGSPRIWACLRRRGIFISEKVVRRLMKEERIEVRYAKRKRKYSSYIGEVTPSVADRVKRRFRAQRPNQIWLTDISEFAAADGKLYLSPMIDCYDGMVTAWRTSRHPDIALVEGMLNDAVGSLDAEYLDELRSGRQSLIIHTDRGGHYRGGTWIERLESLGITRSMSRKGKSGDNAACEGFFGRMKNEMYYGKKWDKVADIKEAVEAYLHFYNHSRIKMSLGGMSIIEHRIRQFGSV